MTLKQKELSVRNLRKLKIVRLVSSSCATLMLSFKRRRPLNLGKAESSPPTLLMALTDKSIIEPALANTLRECIEDMQKGWKLTGFPVVTFGTTSEPGRVPMSILSCFKHEVTFDVGVFFVYFQSIDSV